MRAITPAAPLRTQLSQPALPEVPVARARRVNRGSPSELLEWSTSCRLHAAEEIAAITYQNKAVIYNLLLPPPPTVRTIAADPRHLGAES